LGLAICRQLAGLMGGEVGLLSDLDHGSTFWARVRLAIDPAALPNERSSLAGGRILYVDSNPMQRLIIAEQCAEWCMRSEAADAVPRALHLLRRAKAAGDSFSLAIVDFGATEVAVKVSTDSSYGHPALVLLSDVGTRGKAAELANAGFKTYLSRPLR